MSGQEPRATEDAKPCQDTVCVVVALDCTELLRAPEARITADQGVQSQLASDLVSVEVRPELLTAPLVPRGEPRVGIERNAGDDELEGIEPERLADVDRVRAERVLDHE